ncbi:MAG: sigma-70 family RNA polymerase sigma factor [Planctomycetes bacterium]|nr:sigma-70 family RNA polymerase sigma factor [Planctomycetota bacterium]
MLASACGGQPAAQLAPLVYRELRSLARQWMAREPKQQTLQPTALVHEAFIRLVGTQDVGWNGRRHFFGAAAEAMRRILIERARRRRRLKHGGDFERMPLSESLEGKDSSVPPLDALVLDEAISKLEHDDERAAEVVKMKFYGGLSHRDIADCLQVAEITVERDWRYARSFLQAHLQ